MNKMELIKAREKIDNQIEQIEEEERLKRLDENAKKMKLLKDNKEFLISITKHERTSCNDDKVINGINYEGRYRCTKCAMIEILNGDFDDYDIQFDVCINKIN